MFNRLWRPPRFIKALEISSEKPRNSAAIGASASLLRPAYSPARNDDPKTIKFGESNTTTAAASDAFCRFFAETLAEPDLHRIARLDRIAHLRLRRPVGGVGTSLEIRRHHEEPLLRGFSLSRLGHTPETGRLLTEKLRGHRQIFQVVEIPRRSQTSCRNSGCHWDTPHVWTPRTKDKWRCIAARKAAASPGIAANDPATAQPIAGEPGPDLLKLSAPKHFSTQPAQRGSFSVQPVDLLLDRRRQRRGSSVPAKPAEDVLEMQVGLGRDMPAAPFPLKFGDELARCCHPRSIAPFAAAFRPRPEASPRRRPVASWPAIHESPKHQSNAPARDTVPHPP
jgi:hypothetical protein